MSFTDVTASDIETIEVSIEDAQKVVDRHHQLEKLMSNREFKKIILEGYFKEEPARITSCLADPNLQAFRGNMIDALSAISALQQYFRMIGQAGVTAANEIAVAREALDEFRTEAA